VLGHDPGDVAALLQQAYGIRSSFVHGGFVTPKEQKKIESLYGNQQEFLKRLLNCARISITVMVTLHSKPRDEVLALIEESMISAAATKQLEELLGDAANILQLDAHSLEKGGH